MKFEQEAYAKTLERIYAHKGAAWLQDPKTKATFVGYFTSAAYLWTWPFPKSIEAWYDATVTRIIASPKT